MCLLFLVLELLENNVDGFHCEVVPQTGESGSDARGSLRRLDKLPVPAPTRSHFAWIDVLADKPAFNTLIWFGTLVPLAGGLAQVGVVGWLAGLIGPTLSAAPTIEGLPG
jgi:hypothetical protein